MIDLSRQRKASGMRVKPTAADFDCFIDGKLVAWNHESGLSLRWLAANRALSANEYDLDAAASEVTRLAKGELQIGCVEVRRRERCLSVDNSE